MYGSVKIGFKDGTPRDTLWITKQWTDLVCQDPADRLAPPPGYTYPDVDVLVQNMDTSIDPKKICTLVECPPWKRDHVKALARFCGTWRSLTSAHVQIEILGEMGPPRSQIWTQAVPNLRRVCFATYTNTTGAWVLHADAWVRIVFTYPALTVPMDA
eukprot:1185633-Pyramimonas_sp.AAC.1